MHLKKVPAVTVKNKTFFWSSKREISYFVVYRHFEKRPPRSWDRELIYSCLFNDALCSFLRLGDLRMIHMKGLQNITLKLKMLTQESYLLEITWIQTKPFVTRINENTTYNDISSLAWFIRGRYVSRIFMLVGITSIIKKIKKGNSMYV